MPLSKQQETATERIPRKTWRKSLRIIKILEESVGTLQEDKAALAAAEHNETTTRLASENESLREMDELGSETLFYRRRRTSKEKVVCE
jgi:hypothetical protein